MLLGTTTSNDLISPMPEDDLEDIFIIFSHVVLRDAPACQPTNTRIRASHAAPTDLKTPETCRLSGRGWHRINAVRMTLVVIIDLRRSFLIISTAACSLLSLLSFESFVEYQTSTTQN